MGEHKVEQHVDEKKAQAFMKALLEDLRALAFMLEDGRIESGVTRIGAEQEMFLIDRYLRPAPVSLEVLKQANDPRLTTEIARFNLEANLTPLELTNNCFSRMEQELSELIDLARNGAATQDADVLLSGILPTLQKSDLTLDNLTPVARYHELDRGVIRLRGGPLSIHIKGSGRTAPDARQHHDGIVQHEFPGPLSKQRQRIRQSLQRRAGDNCAGAGRRGQFAAVVWSTFVAGNARRPVSAFNRRALASATRAQPTNARQLRRSLAAEFSRRTLSRSDHSFSSDHDHAAGRESV